MPAILGGPRRPGWSDGGLSLGLRPVFAPAKAASARSRSSVWRMAALAMAGSGIAKLLKGAPQFASAAGASAVSDISG